MDQQHSLFAVSALAYSVVHPVPSDIVLLIKWFGICQERMVTQTFCMCILSVSSLPIKQTRKTLGSVLGLLHCAAAWTTVKLAVVHMQVAGERYAAMSHLTYHYAKPE